MALTVIEAIQHAGVPALAGIKGDIERHAAVGVPCVTVIGNDMGMDGAQKILIAVFGAEGLVFLKPVTADAAAADDLALLDLENIGEIAAV